jgi:ABC-type uncharacterized transport system involved in gliding motility auxiliary subunit
MPGKVARNRNWTYGSNSVIATLLFLGTLIFIVLIAEKHPWRLDLTETGTYTLSEQTLNVLKTLDKPVQIKGFFQTATPEEGKAQDLLDTYRFASKNISFELVDPDRQPEVAKSYEVRAYGTLVLEGYGRKQVTQNFDEESVTNALLKLSRNEQKKIYFLIGHAEHPLASMDKDGYANLKTALEKDNYQAVELNLLQQAEVPRDAAAVVVAGPQKTLLPQEIDTLKQYADGGGRLMVFLDPFFDGGLKDFLAGYGIKLGDDIVVDKLSRVFGGSYLMPVVMEYGRHKITDNFGVATFYPEARSVQPIKPAPKGVQLEILASTSPQAWAEKNVEVVKQGQAAFDEKEDTPGPIPLVVISEIDAAGMKAGTQPKTPGKSEAKAGEKMGYLLAAGDSDFVCNTYFSVSGNGDLFLNMVNFMAEEESLITVKPREKEGKLVMLSQTQAQAILWMVMVLVPLMVILCGLAVYRVRRSQR